LQQLLALLLLQLSPPLLLVLLQLLLLQQPLRCVRCHPLGVRGANRAPTGSRINRRH
jgi:hypothetical protein